MSKKEEQDKILREAEKINLQVSPISAEDLKILIRAESIRKSRVKYEALKDNNRLRAKHQKLCDRFWKQDKENKYIVYCPLDSNYILQIGIVTHSDEVECSMAIHNPREDGYDEIKRNRILAERLLSLKIFGSWKHFAVLTQNKVSLSEAAAMIKSYILLEVLSGLWKEETPLTKYVKSDPHMFLKKSFYLSE